MSLKNMSKIGKFIIKMKHEEMYNEVYTAIHLSTVDLRS